MGAASFDILPGSLRRDILGESPCWSPAEGLLYSIDALGQRIRWSRLDGADTGGIAAPSEVGFVALAQNGCLVVGLRDGLYRVDPGVGCFEKLIQGDFDTTSHRINDGEVDRAGRLWYGTMHLDETEPSGHLYCYDGSTQKRAHAGLTVSNGIAWSPDDTVMYHADSGTGRITAFDFEFSTGRVSRPRRFLEDPSLLSDGLTVDADGCLWVAKWDGGRVVRYDPDGAEMSTCTLPVSRTTSCAFAGEHLDVLVVTSAALGREEEPLAGSIFLLDPGVHGIAPTSFSSATKANAP